MRIILTFLAIGSMIFAGAGCGDDTRSSARVSTYSSEEVQAAFGDAGYLLVPRAVHAPGVAILHVRGSDPEITVSVLTDAEQDRVWAELLKTGEYTPGMFAARRANVAVFILQPPVAAKQKERLLKVLDSLPDRGADALVSGS